MDWGSAFSKISDLAALASICCTAGCTAAIVLLALVLGARQFGDLNSQLNQTTHHLLPTLADPPDRPLVQQHHKRPRAFPAWAAGSGANQRRAWRAMLLDHLNSLHDAYQDHQRQLMDDTEFMYWRLRTKYGLDGLAADSSDQALSEGRKVLQQILSPREAIYPDEFRTWLIETEIIPASLLIK